MTQPITSLVLPTTDPTLKPRLQHKVQQYNSRKTGQGDAWYGLDEVVAHRDHFEYRDALYKHYLLVRVLLGAPLDVAKAKAQLKIQYGEAFSELRSIGER